MSIMKSKSPYARPACAPAAARKATAATVSVRNSDRQTPGEANPHAVTKATESLNLETHSDGKGPAFHQPLILGPPCQWQPIHQKAIYAVSDRKDVFVGTKTGSGKSLTYECIPILFTGACVVIITPLISIMSEQCKKLTALGFKATYIGKDSAETNDIINGEYDFIYASPEQLVGDMKWRDVLKSDVYQ
uniref:DNA 3'-5' helicase n=1 Tax=Magallana gigas TaxID=29159 RepID=A0A8W8NL50_MAGGI